MAALESTGFVRFEPPLTNASFCNRHTLCPVKPSRAICSPTSGQKARRPAATPSRSRCQAEADRNTATSEGLQRALAVSDDESDDDLPSLEELSRTAPRPKISTKASKTASTAQRLEQPALDGAALQVDRTQPGLGGRQGDSRDQPMILDDYSDEAEESTSSDVGTGCIGRDTSPHHTLATLELASGPTKSIDTSGPWYDVEEGCYIEEQAPGLGPCEQQGVHSAHTQAQPQTLPQSSTPLQDQTNQQGVGSITWSKSVESAVYSLPKPFDSYDGWTDGSVAELETELGMASEEQGNSLSASTPRSAGPSHLQIDQKHDQSGTGNVRLEELILGTPLRSQDQGDEPQEQHQRQEAVVGSPVDSSRLTRGSTQGPIILSDDESVGAESETDYSNLGVDLTAKGDSHPPYIADSDLADGDGFGSGTTLISNRLVANHQDDGNDNCVVNDTQLQLSADRPESASPGHRSVTHQASKLRVNTDTTQGSTSQVNLDVTEELEDRDFSVFAEECDEDDNDTRSTKKSKLSAVSGDNPAFDSNISELQDDQPNHAQSPQLGPAVASLQQSGLTNDPLPRHRRRQDATRNARRKRPRTPAPTGLASAARTVSAALESNDLKDPQSVAQITAPDQERELRDINLEMVDDGSTDDSNDGDYADESDAAGSKIGGRPRSRKWVRQTKDTKDNDVAAPSTHSLNVSYQATAATSSCSMQESEEIPIHGYLTLKTIESKVVYCLTFSQELLPKPSGTSQRQGIARSDSSSSDRRDSEQSPVPGRDMSTPARNSRFSPEEDELLLQLKREGLSWDVISDRFPERSKGTLQVHYSTKLKRRSETSKKTKKRRRSE